MAVAVHGRLVDLAEGFSILEKENKLLQELVDELSEVYYLQNEYRIDEIGMELGRIRREE